MIRKKIVFSFTDKIMLRELITGKKGKKKEVREREKRSKDEYRLTMRFCVHSMRFYWTAP